MHLLRSFSHLHWGRVTPLNIVLPMINIISILLALYVTHSSRNNLGRICVLGQWSCSRVVHLSAMLILLLSIIIHIGRRRHIHLRIVICCGEEYEIFPFHVVLFQSFFFLEIIYYIIWKKESLLIKLVAVSDQWINRFF